MDWEYNQPVDIQFGNGSIKDIDKAIQKIKGHKGILVTSPFFVKNNVSDKIISFSENKIQKIYSDISPNPDIHQIAECIELVEEYNADFVVALGGGSVIDAAKVVSLLSYKDGEISEYYSGDLKLLSDSIPLIAIPATSGTGSEVTQVAVISDYENNVKKPLLSSLFYPKIALIDPELTYTLSPYMTAQTGIDALSHAIEAYWSKNHNPISDALAVHAIKNILKYLEVAYRDSVNVIAREKMSEAALIAGLAFNLPKTTAIHACSFPLTNIYHIPHGEACGITLDYFIRHASSNKKEGYRIHELAENIGLKDGFEFADVVENLKKKLNLKLGLKEYNLSEQQISELVEKSHHPNLKNYPIDVSDDDLLDLYNELKNK